METKLIGILKVYFLKRGFGFITTFDGNGAPTGKYFMHFSSVISGKPCAGVTVRFNVSPDREGELPTAIDIEIVEGSAL